MHAITTVHVGATYQTVIPGLTRDPWSGLAKTDEWTPAQGRGDE